MPRPTGVKSTRPPRATEKRKLTDVFVRGVQPHPERRTIYDTVEPGLALRVMPSGARSWKLAYRAGGRPRWYTIAPFGPLAAARERARQLKARMILEPGYDPQAEKMAPRRAGTLRELVEAYLEQGAPAKSRALYRRLLAAHALPRWGSWPALEVTRDHVRGLIRKREQEAPASANLLRAVLSGMFKWAISEGHLVMHPDANPARGILAGGEANGSRERVLANAEVATFWAALADLPVRQATALRLVLLTGQRPGEVRHLRRQDIERIDDGAWWNLPGAPSEDGTWPGTKNGQAHRVWLTPTALALLDALPGAGQPSGYVLPGGWSRVGTRCPLAPLDGVMRKVSAQLGFDPPVTPHDLRRTHGTTVTSLQLGRDAMNRVQNHREGGIGSVYDRHEYRDEARKVQEAVGRRLAQLIGGSVSGVIELAARRA